MTNAILHQLEGMQRQEAIKVLVAALQTLVVGMTAKDLPGIVTTAQHHVPVKKLKEDPYAQVWEYLGTIREYTTGKELRAKLVQRFGEAGTPCLSNLYKHLRKKGKR